MSLTVTMCALVPRHSWWCLWNQITALSDTYLSYAGCLYPDSEVPRWTWWRETQLQQHRSECPCWQFCWISQAMMTGPALQCRRHLSDKNVTWEMLLWKNEGNVGEELKKFWWAERWIALETSYLPSFRFLSDSWDSTCFPRQFQLRIENNSLTEGFKSAWMLQGFHPSRKQAPWAHGWGVGAETGRPSWGWIQVGVFFFFF